MDIVTFINEESKQKFDSQFMGKVESEDVNFISDDKPLLDTFLKNVKSWKATEIQFHTNDNKIVKSISHIQFSALKNLSLEQKIQTIEGLNRIWMPNLDQLFIIYNFILSVKGLSKGYWPEIKYISMQGNKALDIQEMTKANFKQLDVLNIEYWGNDFQMCPDMRWFLKAQIKSINNLSMPINYLGLNSTNRIKHNLLENVIKRKYSKIEISSMD